jgi:dihydroceramidase
VVFYQESQHGAHFSDKNITEATTAEARAKTQFWGEVTANIDWCEHNYVYTSYVAEVFNCFSNLPYVVVGVYCAYRNAQFWAAEQSTQAGQTKRHHGIDASTDTLRIAFAYLTLAVTGAGSMMFHGMLTAESQLGTESSQ